MNEASYRTAEKILWESYGRAPSEQFVRLPRIGVKVRVQEVGAGDPVLFIHGGPDAGSTWARKAFFGPGIVGGMRVETNMAHALARAGVVARNH